MNPDNNNNDYKNNYFRVLTEGHKNISDLKKNISQGMTFMRYMTVDNGAAIQQFNNKS